jgi:hypothetical protein
MRYRLNRSNRKNGRVYLTIEGKYWDKDKKQARSKAERSLGYLDDLQKEFSDPIAHFQQEVDRLNAETESTGKVTLTVDMNEQLEEESDNRYNIGYAVIMKVYRELGLDRFFNNKARHEGFQYNTNSIMELLVFSRLLAPGSKKSAFERKERYFERFDFELQDVYRALSHFAKIGKECQEHLNGQIQERYGRDVSVVYFDVTNFYFEIDREDEWRKFGKSKEGRHDPIIQLGLAMDNDGIPLHYELFPGNTADCKIFIPVVGEVRRQYNTGRVIAVADMGVVSSDNIYYLKGGDRDKRLNGYVFSYSILKAGKVFQQYVLDQHGYTDAAGNPPGEDCEFKIKSKLHVREIEVSMQSGAKNKKLIDEKVVVFWNKNYADKAKAERNATIEKARRIIAEPKKYNKRAARGADAYIINISYNKKTGEVVESAGKALSLNEKKIAEEELFDGYYAIVTSELDMAKEKMIEIYRGLWEIEDNFKLSKSGLKLRPVYVSILDRINAHVLTCFLSLVIMRIIQKKTNYRITPQNIAECLNRASCTLEEENIYLFDYRTAALDDIGAAFGIDFTKRRMFLKDIKKILADVKKI